MMLLRLINAQGIAGLAASICLAILLVLQKGETRHWRKQSASFEQLYHSEHAAFAGTVANYRAAAEQARAADQANLARVTAQQRAISERTSNDFEARLAAARSIAQRLRGEGPSAPADSRAGRAAPVPALPATPSGAAQAASQDRFPGQAALTATEQAIQLDELIKWVRAQAKVDNNPPAVASSPDR
jgi:hypothetical protein